MSKGLGIDIEEVSRFRDKLNDDHFLQLLFTEREIQYCRQKQDPAASFAGKFCAKEAMIKASAIALGMKEIEIIQEESGKLSVYIKGQKQDLISCSITHTGNYAAAVVLMDNLSGSSVQSLTPSPAALFPFSSDKMLAYLTISISVQKLQGFIQRFQKEKNINISIADLVSWVISRKLKQYPELNSVYTEKLHLYPEVNMGYFLNLGNGVKLGVIKNADSLSLSSFSKEIKNLALQYMRGTLKDYKAEECTFAITNLSFSGVPSLLSPVFTHQSIMISLGAEYDAVEILDGAVLPARKCNVSLSFDVRVADCQRIASFLKEIQQSLENLEKATDID